MKKTYLFFAVLFLAIVVNAQTILIDCQYDATKFPSASPWNNVFYNSDMDIIDSNSAAAGHIVLSGWTQGNSSGTTAPAAPAIDDFPTSVVTQDNIYGQSGGTGTITFSGLNPVKYYSFTIFASRAGATDNRETTYTITGTNSGSASLNPSSNSSEVAIVNSIQPTTSGTITFTAVAGINNVNSNKYFYLAAMKIVASTTSSVGNVLLSNKIYYAKNSLIAEDMTGVVKIYNITGARVAEGSLSNGKFNVQLKKGIYIVSIGDVNQKINVR